MFSYARNVKETMGTKFYILLAVKVQTQRLQKKQLFTWRNLSMQITFELLLPYNVNFSNFNQTDNDSVY